MGELYSSDGSTPAETSVLINGAADGADAAAEARLGCGACTGKLSIAGVSKLTVCMLPCCMAGTDQLISTVVAGANGSSNVVEGTGCIGLFCAHSILDCGITGADAGPILANWYIFGEN